MSSVDEGLKDVLLNLEIVFIDASQPFAHFGEVVDSLTDSEPADIVAGYLSAQDPVISDVLLDRSILVIAADDGVAEMKILNRGLEFAAVVFGNPAAIDDSQFVRPADGAIGVQQSVSKCVESGAAFKNQIVTILNLSEEDAVLTAGAVSLPFGEERREIAKPFLASCNQVIRQ